MPDRPAKSAKPTAAGGAVPDEYLPPNKTLFLRDLPEDYGKDALAVIFKRYPGFREIRLVPGRNTIAFAEYEDETGAIAAKEGAGGLVVGLPLSMDGSFGPAAHSARDWAKALSDAAGLPAAMWDERLSSAAVNRMLIGEADLSRAKRALVVDRAAAAWMLQAALDATRPRPAPFPDDADAV